MDFLRRTGAGSELPFWYATSRRIDPPNRQGRMPTGGRRRCRRSDVRPGRSGRPRRRWSALPRSREMPGDGATPGPPFPQSWRCARKGKRCRWPRPRANVHRTTDRTNLAALQPGGGFGPSRIGARSKCRHRGSQRPDTRNRQRPWMVSSRTGPTANPPAWPRKPRANPAGDSRFEPRSKPSIRALRASGAGSSRPKERPRREPAGPAPRAWTTPQFPCGD